VVSQGCRKQLANHQQRRKRGREKQEGNFGLVLPKVSADVMQEKSGWNEAEVVRDTYKCDSSKLSLSVMQ